MKKGFFVSITYFAIGLLLTVITYFAFDNSYAHGPSFFHLIALLFFFGGCGWTLVAILQLAFVGRPARRAGIALSNVVILSALYFSFYFLIVKDDQNKHEYQPGAEELVTETRGDTTTISIGGRIIYLKVRDSVWLDCQKANE